MYSIFDLLQTAQPLPQQVDLVTSPSPSPSPIETLSLQLFPLPPNLRLPVSPTHPISPTPHLPHPTAYLPTSPPPLSSPASPPLTTPNDPEPVYLLVIGSRRGITAIVHSLHVKQFAHIHEWSPYQNHSSGRLLRILTRYV